MYSNEQRFVWDINDLFEIIKNPSETNLLAASAILRRLLLDSPEPLVHKVARGRDFKPRFRVVSSSDYEDALKPILDDPSLLFMWADPQAFNPKIEREVDLDDFFRVRITHFEGQPLTIKEVISYVANVGGGVHQGTPRKKDNAEFIHSSANRLIMSGMPYPLYSIKPIARIVFEALQPLYRMLRA